MTTQHNMFQAFGSPMLGSTIVTAPRRQGDGMDKESLLLEDVSSPAQTPPKLRHINLTSTHGTQSVNKVKGQKVIPHEPVRGAVKPVDTGRDSPSPRSTDTRTPPPPSEKPPPLDAVKLSGIETPPTQMKPVAPESRIRGLPSKLLVTADDQRLVEGETKFTSIQEIERLNKTVTDLEAQLEVQSKVNADLKKLLVASMGDDLHHKVDTLVRTKAQLATDIGGYTDRIYEDHETLDKVLIQADMWRSKFKASRVLIDQLVEDRDSLRSKSSDAERALQQFLQERQQLRDTLTETHRYLKLLRDSFDPVGAKRHPATIPNILELARTNHLLADSVKFRLLPAMPIFPSVLDAGLQHGSSPAEKLANQVLSTQPEVETSSCGANLVRLAPSTLGKYDRFHPQVRYENITFNCCAQCKGEVKVL